MDFWDVLTERDRAVLGKLEKLGLVGRRGGLGGRQDFGSRPAIMVVDVTLGCAGDRPEPILESIERFPLSCGEEAWQGIYQIRRLLEKARERAVPIIYTIAESAAKAHGRFPGHIKTAEKLSREMEQLQWQTEQPIYTEIAPDVAPHDEDIIVRKSKASAFFGTNLVSYLISLGVDTLLYTGCSTSGCLRATVVSGFDYNFKSFIIEECVWDRFQTSHKVNLFDMNLKYADVVSLTEAEEYLAQL